MRTVRQKIYSFSELSKDAQFKAMCDQIHFEVEIMTEDSPYWQAAEKMERMQTPWFLAETIYHTPEYREMIINSIESNEYEFTKDGKLFNR